MPRPTVRKVLEGMDLNFEMRAKGVKREDGPSPAGAARKRQREAETKEQ